MPKQAFPRLFLAGHPLPIGAGHVGKLIDPITGAFHRLTIFRQTHRVSGLAAYIDRIDALIDKYTLAVQ